MTKADMDMAKKVLDFYPKNPLTNQFLNDMFFVVID